MPQKIDTEICLNGWFVNTMPDLNQSNPLVLNLNKMLSGGLNMQTSTVSESIPITILTPRNCILDKSNHRRIPKFQYCGRNLDAKPQMAYWQKTVKLVL
jgi:hypothetical protein